MSDKPKPPFYGTVAFNKHHRAKAVNGNYVIGVDHGSGDQSVVHQMRVHPDGKVLIERSFVVYQNESNE